MWDVDCSTASADSPVFAELHPVDVNNYRRHFRPSPIPVEAWPVLGSAVVDALADSARAGAEGVRIERNETGGWLRLVPPAP